MHVVGTAGHVDHGKSTLVHALTGIDPDRFEEEKRRGLTIDLGFAWCTLPSGREIGIVDVPGHERFIRNMLAGVGGIDAAIFVVAADEGWKPQSAEHLQILDFLGISGGVVALTKSDAVSAPDLEAARDDVWQRLRGTVLHDAPIVPVSASTAMGLDDLRGALDDVLSTTPQAPDLGRPRLFVDRSFSIAGAGTVVTGTLTGGRLRVDDEIEIAPTGARARIRSLQTHRRTVGEAAPGSRVAANLVGLERSEIARGDAVVRPGQWPTTRSFAARLFAADDLHHPVTARGAYELYLGTADYRCRIKLLEDADTSDAIVAASTPAGLAPAIRPGDGALVQVFYPRDLPVRVGDTFVLRDVGRRQTVAGGIVLDQAPGVIRRGHLRELKRLRAREGLEGRDLAARIVAERGAIARDELDRLAGAEPETSGLHARGTYFVTAGFDADMRERSLAAVARHHEQRPLDAGIPSDDLRRELGLEAELFDALSRSWVSSGLLRRERGVLADPQRAGTLSEEHRAIADRALRSIRDGGASPPGLREIGVPADLVKALERSGELVRVAPDIAYPADIWADLRRRVIDHITSKGPATVSQLREVLRTSRKFAVPVLEHMDATGVTRRNGDVRDLGPRAKS